MVQKEYAINILSRLRLIIAMIILTCLSTIIVNDYTPRIDNRFLSFLQFFIIYALSFYVATLVATAKVKVILTDEAIFHIWKRRFPLSWEKNVKIPWNIVDNYAFESDKTCDSIIVNLTNKKQYKIDKQNILPITDDFEKLEKEFIRLNRKNDKIKNGNPV